MEFYGNVKKLKLLKNLMELLVLKSFNYSTKRLLMSKHFDFAPIELDKIKSILNNYTYN